MWSIPRLTAASLRGAGKPRTLPLPLQGSPNPSPTAPVVSRLSPAGRRVSSLLFKCAFAPALKKGPQSCRGHGRALERKQRLMAGGFSFRSLVFDADLHLYSAAAVEPRGRAGQCLPARRLPLPSPPLQRAVQLGLVREHCAAL